MKQAISQVLEAPLGRRLITEESAMIARVEAALISGAVRYCESHGYQLVLIPHLTKATGACENFSTLFKTDLFGEAAYLNQTGQLMLEAFMERFEKTYCYGPSFRKETKADDRHLIEFPLFEIEVAECDLERLKHEISNIIRSMLASAESSCSHELFHLCGDADLSSLMPPYRSITYQKAINHLGLSFGDDLKSSHEQELVKLNGGKPLFVTHYPQRIKFFNMRLNREDPLIVNSMDLLMPFSGEAVGAAEREEDYPTLRRRLEESDMLRLLKESIREESKFKDSDSDEIHAEAMSRFDWYMDIIKEKPIRHAGCGIGVNRITQAVLRTNDIRHATAFPLNRETLF